MIAAFFSRQWLRYIELDLTHLLINGQVYYSIVKLKRGFVSLGEFVSLIQTIPLLSLRFLFIFLFFFFLPFLDVHRDHIRPLFFFPTTKKRTATKERVNISSIRDPFNVLRLHQLDAMDVDAVGNRLK